MSAATSAAVLAAYNYGFALGAIVGACGLYCVAVFLRWEPIARALDRLYARFWRLPACVPGHCYCRRTCVAMLGEDPNA